MSLPDDILQVGRANQAELAALNTRVLAALRRQLASAISSVQDDLVSSSSVFERGQLRWVELVLSAMQGRTSLALERVVSVLARGGAGLGQVHALEELAAWAALGGRAAPLNLSAAAGLADKLLAERLTSSIAIWKREGIERMRPHLVRAVLTRKSDSVAADAIEQAFGARRFAAERIVRTELSHAYHTAHLEQLRRVRDQDGLAVQKTCIAVFDTRTAADSVPVHYQVRDLDEEFVDGEGRRYLAPPGRPNDREKMVAYLPL